MGRGGSRDEAGLLGNDDLVARIASKNDPEKAKLSAKLDALLKGRHSLTPTANGRAGATSSEGVGDFFDQQRGWKETKNGCIDFR
jgi:hypothetical protein